MTNNIKNSRCVVIVFCGLMFISTGFSQQVQQFLFTPWSQMAFNPGSTGMDGSVSISGGLRRQWNQLPGQPEAQQLFIQMPLPFISSGIGLLLHQEKAGLYNQTAFGGAYSYHLPVSESWTLGIGLGAGFIRARLNGAEIRTPQGQYPGGGINHNDGLLVEDAANGSSILFHGGIMVRRDHFQTGIALQQFNTGVLRLQSEQASTGIGLVPHLYWHAAYELQMEVISLRPILALRTDFRQLQAEGMIFGIWNERIILGAGWRGWGQNSIDAWVLSGGLNIGSRLMILYAWESGVSALNRAHKGSFEINMRYNVPISTGRGILPPRIHTPRFL